MKRVKIASAVRREDGNWTVTFDCGHITTGVAHMDFENSVGRSKICTQCPVPDLGGGS